MAGTNGPNGLNVMEIAGVQCDSELALVTIEIFMYA